jgi:predicted dehydrogenase
VQLFASSSFPQDTWYDDIEIFGTDGAYQEVDGGPHARQARWFVGKAWVGQAPEPAERLWLNSMDNLAAAIRTGAELVCSARDGRQTQAILDAMYRSAGNGGGWVSVA